MSETKTQEQGTCNAQRNGTLLCSFCESAIRQAERTQEEVKHTPTPWSYIKGKTLCHVETDIDAPVAGSPVCSIPNSREADAAHIVHCVNSHATLTRERDSLREALEKIVEHEEKYVNQSTTSTALTIARQILSATKGRKG